MLLILPTQLFEIKYLADYRDESIILYEHPQYFTKYKFNKKKLILHRSSMKYYFDYLKKNKFNVKYLEYMDKLPDIKFKFFDPIDKIKIKGTIIESPNFILTKKMYAEYRIKTDKFIFNNFYLWSKKKIDLYPKLKSLDKLNRNRYNNDIKIPDIPSNINDTKYIKEATQYVENHFPNNYGNTKNFIYPTTHKTAKNWIINFVENKLNNFGTYQDFVKKDNNFMFHSILSSSINIGLLNPSEIITILHKYKKKVAINSFEGYLRQLFWREYQRYTSIYIKWGKKNYFGNTSSLTTKWYSGNLGIDPVDDLIKSGFDTGYIHHIGRLMFVGNFMNLSGISPNQGFKWFMEFSIDSYEWVMYQNVRDMVFFETGGLTMRKPYITSSNYILKNSNYKKGEWSEKWDKLYILFLKKNKSKLWKFRYSFPTLKNI
jgi:deoxyribodipyrimidine photolyase-related protein